MRGGLSCFGMFILMDIIEWLDFSNSYPQCGCAAMIVYPQPWGPERRKLPIVQREKAEEGAAPMGRIMLCS